MCGIAGSFGKKELDPVVGERVREALRHRGPDGSGSKSWPGATLVHTRLRIIDLSPTGDQPMSNEDGSVWTAFNGEIYNHHELQVDLEKKGHRFRGRSDTEVLPHLYEEYGDSMFIRLRGMFAVAILDQRQRRLLLARDRFGIKPLFYAADGSRAAFASEINALREFPGVDLTPDPQAIADFAGLLFVPAPHTIHRGISALQPGEVVDFRLDNDERVSWAQRQFHEFTSETNRDLTFDRALDNVDPLVEKAVVRQLESDVPLGALLSGGIDSSLVSLYSQRHVDDDLLTFNVRFPDDEYDETPAARTVADAIGSRHRTLDMGGQSGTWEQITDLMRIVGQPFADTSLFAVDQIAAAMRQHVTVALSGDGGDEGFGGYDVYWQIAAVNGLRRAPAFFWRAGAPFVAPLARLGVVRPTLAHRMRDLAGADDTGILQTFFSWLGERELRELTRPLDAVEPLRRLFEPHWRRSAGQGASPLERLSAHAVELNMRLILANDYLPKVDAGSMRHSLEVRVPMLDEDLIAFGLTLPHALRVEGRKGKRLLRGLAGRHLPASIAARPKRGFSVPVDRWVDSSFHGTLRESLLDAGSPVGDYFVRSVYAPWVEAFCGGDTLPGLSREGLYQRVMMLLALDVALRDLTGSRRRAAA
jgi:asparagine synthase (glutamine-hydrolysing)